jgi:hypothetical protein
MRRDGRGEKEGRWKDWRGGERGRSYRKRFLFGCMIED